MAIKKTIEVEAKATGFDAAEKSIDGLSKAIDNANESVTDLNSTFEEVYGEMAPLTTRMGEAEDRLYELAAAGDTASNEYQGLLTKVGEYRKVQIKTDLAVDSAATTLGQKLGGALGGATASFAAVQGVMGLVGSESELLEKSLLKVQSALAIQQGVEGIRQAIPGFKMLGKTATTAFKGMTKASKAFAVTGIGVVLVAVAALAYALNELEEAEKKAEEARQKRHDTVMKDYDAEIAKKRKAAQAVNDQLDVEQTAREQQVKLLQAQGKSITEAEWEVAQGFMDNIQTKGQALKEEYLRLGKETQAAYITLHKEFRGSLNNTQDFKDREEAATKIVDAKKASNKAEQKLLFDQMTELAKIRDSQFDNMEVLEAQHLQNRKLKNKAYNLELESMRRKIEDLEIDLLEEGVDKEVVINKTRFERLIADIKGHGKEARRLKDLYLTQQLESEKEIREKFLAEEINEEAELQEKFDEIQRENEDRFRTEKENELLLVKEKYDALEAAAQGNKDALDQIETARLNERNDINMAYDDEAYAVSQASAAALKEINDAELDEAIANEEKKRLAKLETIDVGLDFAKQGADAIQSLGDLVFANKMDQLEEGSKEEEEMARKQFKFNKAMQLGGAVIDAGKAVVASLASAPLAYGIVPNPIGIASLAAVGVTSALNIAKIAATKFESPGGPPDTTVPSLGAGAPPQFNVVGDSGINQLANVNQQPTQAYVVSGDVTTAQSLDRNRVQNATI